MKKVCVVVQSRANYARIKSFLSACKASEQISLDIIASASMLLYRHGRPLDIMLQDGFIPRKSIYSTIDGDEPVVMAKSTGLTIIELSSAFEEIRPDFVLTVADRYETMATAIASSYMNIPLVHTQGGEVTGSIDESVRHSITKLAHVHFPATQKAAEYLRRMGEDPESVFTVGCPSMDLIPTVGELDLIDVISEYGGVGGVPDFAKPYVMAVFHPVTTEYESSSKQVKELLNSLIRIRDQGIQVIMLWPNIDAGSDSISKSLRDFREGGDSNGFFFFKNFSPEHYIVMLRKSLMIIGNSSSGLREASFIGLPSVNIGNRQRGRERASNTVDCVCSTAEIDQAVMHQLEIGRYEPSTLYGDGYAGQKMADIIKDFRPELQKRLHYD